MHCERIIIHNATFTIMIYYYSDWSLSYQLSRDGWFMQHVDLGPTCPYFFFTSLSVPD